MKAKEFLESVLARVNAKDKGDDASLALLDTAILLVDADVDLTSSQQKGIEIILVHVQSTSSQRDPELVLLRQGLGLQIATYINSCR